MTRILDDNGRLYGIVNVVDLLVVLAVLAVIAGGAVLLLGPFGSQTDTATPTETETRYATLSIVDVPVEAADEIQVGDSVSHNGNDLTVTDVYVAENETNRDVAVRVALNGQMDGDQFTYGGSPPRIARILQLQTETYNVEGNIRDVGPDGESLALQERDVVVETTMPTETFDSIEAGDTYEVGGQTLATIESVEAYGTEPPNSAHVKLDITYTTLERSSGPYVGPIQLRDGVTLPFEGPDYEFTGTVLRTDGKSLALQERDIDVVTTIPAETLESIEAGDTYEVGGQTLATIESVEAYGTEPPNSAYVKLEMTYTALERRSGPYVGTTRLRDGVTLPFEGPDYEFTGTVLRTDGESLALQERDVVVETTMPTETFDSIEAGDIYEVGGQTLATIEFLEAYSTGSPGVVRVKAGITYTALERRAGPYVGATLLREGESLPFDGPVYDFEGTIERTGALEPRGERATRTVTLELEDIDEATASTVTAGAAETVGGEQVATVTNVEEEPATLVLTNRDGEVFVRDHPTKRNLQLTVEMQVRETTAGPTFKGEPLRQGDTVTLDLGAMTVRPTVVRM